MPMLIWVDGGAPPAGPGIPASVLTAMTFHWVIELASASSGGAADAPMTPSAPSNPTAAAAASRTSRLRAMMPLSVCSPVGRLANHLRHEMQRAPTRTKEPLLACRGGQSRATSSEGGRPGSAGGVAFSGCAPCYPHDPRPRECHVKNTYPTFIANPHQGDNLFALLDEVPVHTTKKEPE